MTYQAFVFHSPLEKEYACGGVFGSGQYTGQGYIYNGQIIFFVGMDNYIVTGTRYSKAVVKWYDLDDKTWKVGDLGQESDGIWNTPTYKNHLNADTNSRPTQGVAINITRMNDVIYGSSYYDSHSGGSHYTLRHSGYRTLPGSYASLMEASTKGVAFGESQGFLYANSDTYDSPGSARIRMYGYYDSNEVWHETTGNYIEIDVTQHPSNYPINTY